MNELIVSKVAIATGTLYTGATASERVRAQLAVRTIQHATDLGYAIVALDQGSSEELVEAFKKAGAVVKQMRTPTFGAGRREAMKAAAEFGKEVIVWTEPEKLTFIDEIEKTVEPILRGEADMVIPRRQSLASYPTAQQWSEPFANMFVKELTGYDLDTFFGPRVFKRELLPYFLRYEDMTFGDRWDTLFVPLLDMMQDGKKLISVTVDYTHPSEQTAVEEHDVEFYEKRLVQLNNLIPSIKNHWEKLKGK